MKNITQKQLTTMKSTTTITLALGVGILLTVISRAPAQGPDKPSDVEQPLFPTRDSVKGMKLKVSPNGRYFVDQDGKPFFYLGDTAWLLIQRLNREELDVYLKDRAGKGFTVIQAYVIRGLEAVNSRGEKSLIGASPLIDRTPPSQMKSSSSMWTTSSTGPTNSVSCRPWSSPSRGTSA